MAMRTLGTFGVRTAWYDGFDLTKVYLCVIRHWHLIK